MQDHGSVNAQTILFAKPATEWIAQVLSYPTGKMNLPPPDVMNDDRATHRTWLANETYKSFQSTNENLALEENISKLKPDFWLRRVV